MTSLLRGGFCEKEGFGWAEALGRGVSLVCREGLVRREGLAGKEGFDTTAVLGTGVALVTREGFDSRERLGVASAWG